MRIWVDGQCLQTESRNRGIGRYVNSLLRMLATQYPQLEIIVSLIANLPREAVAARAQLLEYLPKDAVRVWQAAPVLPEVNSGYDKARQMSEIALNHHVAALKPDVILATSPYEGFGDSAVPFNPCISKIAPVAQIFYDAIPDRFPSYYLSDPDLRKAHNRRRKFYSECDLILSISNFANKEAKELFPDALSVPIYAGLSGEFRNIPTGPSDMAAPVTDFLYVGALDFRKNVTSLIKAFAMMKAQYGASRKLAIAGAYHAVGKVEVEQAWHSSGLKMDDLTFHGRVSDHDLIQLYRSAQIVVQPSLMEGFGLTALEGVAAGACVAGSQGTALEEIIIDERALFDPDDPSDIGRVLHELYESKDLRRDVSRTQQVVLNKFTWERTAKLALENMTDLAHRTTRANRDAETDTIRRETLELLKDVTGGSKLEKTARLLASNEPAKTEFAPRLAIDVTSTTRIDHKTGIQRVVNRIVAGVGSSAASLHHDFSLLYCDNRDGWTDMGSVMVQDRKEFPDFVARPNDTILMLDSSWEFFEEQFLALWDARLKGSEIITCLYDTVPLRQPAYCIPFMPGIFTSWFETALKYSSGFVCISKAVADELHAIFQALKFPRSIKIGYWPLGADFAQKQVKTARIEDSDKRENLNQPSFLMVGTLEPRKGHEIALNAFDLLWSEGFEGSLTIIGKQGWGINNLVQRIENHPEFGKKLLWKSGVSDAELAAYYQVCDALIASSYAEGFGLPIVEAGQMGKPVFASDIPVFREVAKSAPRTFFFKVGSSEQLATQLRGFRKENKTKTWKVPDWPTWQQSADRLAQVILGGDWYLQYTPPENIKEFDAENIGDFVMTDELRGARTTHVLAVAGQPTTSDDGQYTQYTIAVTNQSSILWSSRCTDGKDTGVRLGYELTDENGKVHKERSSTEIPFILAPSDTIYLPVRLERSRIPAQACRINFFLHQGENNRWGEGISVDLPAIGHA